MTSITAAAPRTTDAPMYRRMSRLLLGAGAAQLIGGVLMLALGGEYASGRAATLFSVGWGVGWALIGLALVSMTRTAVAGDRAGRLLPLIPSIGAASYVLAEIWWVANLTVGGRTAEAIEGDPVVFLLPAGALLGAVGMVVVGVAVIRARRWMVGAGLLHWSRAFTRSWPCSVSSPRRVRRTRRRSSDGPYRGCSSRWRPRAERRRLRSRPT